VTRTRGWTLSASSLSRLPPKAVASTGGALERPRVQEQQPTPGLSHQTRSPTISLTQPTSLKNAQQYVTDSKDGARRLARRGRVTRSPTPVNVGRRGRRGGRPRGTTRSCPVFVDAGRLPPRGTTRVCLLVRHSRWRPTGTTWWSTEGHDAGVPVSDSRWRPTGTTLSSTKGHDTAVPVGHSRWRPTGTTRWTTRWSTAGHDAGVPGRRRCRSAGVRREARRGCVLCSSASADGDRQARRGGAQPKVSLARGAASTVPTNRRCRRVHRWMGGRDATGE